MHRFRAAAAKNVSVFGCAGLGAGLFATPPLLRDGGLRCYPCRKAYEWGRPRRLEFLLHLTYRYAVNSSR